MATWYWGWGYDDWSGASASSGGGLPHRPSKDSLRPVTEFATVLAAIDENHQGDHVHVTDAKQLSINCFPTGFAQVMAGSFGIHCSTRKRPRDNRGRVTCKGAKVIVEHAGLYMEKICESLTAVVDNANSW